MRKAEVTEKCDAKHEDGRTMAKWAIRLTKWLNMMVGLHQG